MCILENSSYGDFKNIFVYADLKPHNILLSLDEKQNPEIVYLGDLGSIYPIEQLLNSKKELYLKYVSTFPCHTGENIFPLLKDKHDKLTCIKNLLNILFLFVLTITR